MIPFPFNENRFSFFIADHILIGQLCTNPKSERSLDPSYNNKTIASTLKMQIWTIQRLRAQLNVSDDPLEVVERRPKAEDTARKTRTKEFIEKVQGIIDETSQRPIRQIARDLDVVVTRMLTVVMWIVTRQYQ